MKIFLWILGTALIIYIVATVVNLIIRKTKSDDEVPDDRYPLW